MKLPILIAMVLYMAMVIWIGVIYSKKTKTSEDYFLGGRGLGPWVTAMSAEASDMSSWLLMGLPGLAYATGFSQAGWTAIGLILGTYLNWKIVAKRLRHYTEVADNAITVPDFFSNRFKDDKKILSSISAIMILIFFTVYTASGFAACGTLFNSVFGLNYQKSMIVCAIVIVLYTSMGGFLAASTTDLIQGLLMSFAIVIVLIVGVVNAGGVANVIAHGQAMEGFFDVMKYHDPATGDAVSQGVIPILSGLAWGLGYFGMPHILVRFMAIRDPQEVKKSRNIAMIWVLISLSVAVCIGFTGAALYPNVAELAGNGNQRIFIYMTTHLFKGLIPLFMAGVILSGILAATMSTSDSQLLIASSCVSNRTVQLIGTVDRADEWIEDDGTRWVRVVDYKTGTKKLDLREVYCGLDCQMLLYLFSLTRDAGGRFTGAEPAGVLYLLADPAPETTTRGKAARSMEYKLDGLVRDEQKVFDAMDAEETGRYLPFSFRGGVPSPYQKEKRADKAKLSRIQLHLDDLVTQMGEQLYGGCIAAEPLVTGRSPCRWCDYGFICCHEEGIGERALDAPAKPFEPEEKKEEDQ